MKELEHKYFDSREAFRKWLQVNNDKSPGLWIKFYKKHLNIKCITYTEALEEALCFGWIDSIIKKIDDDQYVRKFTPRTNTANWSEINRKIVIRLIKEGRMTEAGLNKIDLYLKTGELRWDDNNLKRKPEEPSEIPDYIIREFAQNEPALKNFNNLSRTFKRQYLLWITSAKREETRQSRLQESVGLLKENKKLGLK